MLRELNLDFPDGRLLYFGSATMSVSVSEVSSGDLTRSLPESVDAVLASSGLQVPSASRFVGRKDMADSNQVKVTVLRYLVLMRARAVEDLSQVSAVTVVTLSHLASSFIKVPVTMRRNLHGIR